jgi:capsular polysaccharide biosynthesis protein
VELKYYVSIVRRRWLPIVLVPVIVFVGILAQMLFTTPPYETTAEFTVTRVPQQIDLEEFRYNEYYLFLSSEFMVDDLVEVVRGNVFAEDVHRRILEEFGVDVPAHEVQMSLSSDRTHRILTLDVSHEVEDHAVMIAQSATRQLSESATRYFGFEDEDREALVSPIQFPGAASPDTGRDQIFWALQIMVALFGGLLIAILLEYLDDRLYTAEMVEHALELDVIGEVPRGRVSA